MNRTIFWDLQGTLGGTATGDITEFVFYPFAADAILCAKDKGFFNIIVTNQSKIGRGIISPADYEETVERLKADLKEKNAEVDEWLVCPHTDSDHCNCKKPKTGLIDWCVQKYHLDISRCYVIGDMGKNEIVMAHNAGCQGILVLTGGGKDSLGKFRNTWADYTADIVAENALCAIEAI